jgi:hypothetical protein
MRRITVLAGVVVGVTILLIHRSQLKKVVATVVVVALQPPIPIHRAISR